jgi:hypothetical protein
MFAHFPAVNMNKYFTRLLYYPIQTYWYFVIFWNIGCHNMFAAGSRRCKKRRKIQILVEQNLRVAFQKYLRQPFTIINIMSTWDLPVGFITERTVV